MTNDVLLYFLGLVVVLFIIVFVIMFIGFRRTRNVKGVTSSESPEPTIKAQQGPIGRRLGGNQALNEGKDPRGDDIGGNFSNVSGKGDNSTTER